MLKRLKNIGRRAISPVSVASSSHVWVAQSVRSMAELRGDTAESRWYELFLVPPAGSAADHLKQRTAVDPDAIRAVARWLESHDEVSLCSINLAYQQTSDVAFRRRLRSVLTDCSSLADRFCFEISAYAAVQSPDATRALGDSIREMGASLALDQISMELEPELIDHFGFSVIKVERKYLSLTGLANLCRTTSRQFFQLVQDRQLMMVALGVRGLADLNALRERDVQHFQLDPATDHLSRIDGMLPTSAAVA